jgi:hypothetical protein
MKAQQANMPKTIYFSELKPFKKDEVHQKHERRDSGTPETVNNFLVVTEVTNEEEAVSCQHSNYLFWLSKQS